MDTALGEVSEALLKHAKENRLSCALAHSLALEFQVSPMAVGEEMDRLSIKIVECQLGLFGYGEKKKDIPQVEVIEKGLKEEIMTRLKDGRLTCKDAWEIAHNRGLERKYMGGVCEKMGIKISNCQLGAF